jgi:hypothetical protein
MSFNLVRLVSAQVLRGSIQEETRRYKVRDSGRARYFDLEGT